MKIVVLIGFACGTFVILGVLLLKGERPAREVLSKAAAAKAEIAKAQAEVNRHQTVLVSKGNQMSVYIPSVLAIQTMSTQDVIRYLRASVPKLVEDGREILSEHEALKKAIDSEYALLKSSGEPTANELAIRFRLWANEQAYSDLREDYIRAATVLENYVAWLQSQEGELTPLKAEIELNLAYVAETVTFLERLNGALETLPDSESFQLPDELLSKLKAYVENYEKLRGILRGYDGAKTKPTPVPTRVTRNPVALKPYTTVPESMAPKGDATNQTVDVGMPRRSSLVREACERYAA